MRSIVEGISAIRRQQQAISSDLSALKDSNDALWKEAIAARERHAQHGDTINRILRFLAGIVGRAVQGPSSAHPHVDGNTRSTKRLMIGDGRQSYDEVGDFGSAYDPHSRQGSREHTPFSVGKLLCLRLFYSHSELLFQARSVLPLLKPQMNLLLPPRGMCRSRYPNHLRSHPPHRLL